jgi:hypothetical protein
MAFVHSKSSRVMVNERHLSGHISGYTAGNTLNLAEVTSLLDQGTTHIPGLLDGTINVDGHFDPTEGSLYDTAKSARQVAAGVVATVMPAGLTLGSPAFLAIANATSFTVDAAVADKVSCAIEGQPNGGVDWGVVVHPHTAVTATADGASVDNTDATTGGGVATLHVTGVSGTAPSATVTVQDSADDVVFVDLITFAAATEATHEYATVSGTVGRYVRASWTITGTSPEFTFAVAFARR